MFSIYNVKNIEHLNYHDVEYFNNILKKLYDKDGRFNDYKTIDFVNINIYWCLDMNDKNGILGCFNHFKPNDLYLAPYKGMKEMLISTVVHELTHKLQLNRYGFVKYCAMNLPMICECTLEKEAHRMEYIAEEYLKQMKII